MSSTPLSLPPPFIRQMQDQLGKEYPDFAAALLCPPPTSFHVNPIKNHRWEENYKGVKWYDGGVYLKDRPVFTLDPAFHAGAYYVQEASSMFIAHAVRQLLDTEQPLRVLDLCAAPGGKSTLLASVLSSDSLLVSNEVIRSRYQVLDYNLTKWGTVNTIRTNHDAREFAGLDNFFDLILIDAPCSGEGLFRKDPVAVNAWSPENIALCSARQKRILADTIPLLRPGGVLLYSTCTYNDEENRNNVEWLREAFGFQPLQLTYPTDWNIVDRHSGYQFYPHRVSGEGFYIAALSKAGSAVVRTRSRSSSGKKNYARVPKAMTTDLSPWINSSPGLSFLQTKSGSILAIPQRWEDEIDQLSLLLPRMRVGTQLGAFKGRDFVPDPALALSTLLSADVPAVEVNKSTALRFLKKEAPDLTAPTGWQVIRHRGLNLGWIKGLKHRINNYYPKAWRIRMEID